MKCIVLVPTEGDGAERLYVQCGQPSSAGMCSGHIAMLSTARPHFVMAHRPPLWGPPMAGAKR